MYDVIHVNLECFIKRSPIFIILTFVLDLFINLYCAASNKHASIDLRQLVTLFSHILANIKTFTKQCSLVHEAV